MITVLNNNKELTCKLGEVITISFLLRAYEDAELTYTPSCGCSNANGPRFVKKEEIFTVDVKFNSEGRHGFNTKSVKIESGDFETKAKFSVNVT
jgi:hypothetical protein